MTKLFICVLSALCIADEVFGAVTRKTAKVKIQVLYECLCPGCKGEWTEELGPVYSELSDYMDMEVLPYGNAKMHEDNGTEVVECQHGEEECYGNTVHACAIDILKEPKAYVPYIACMMKGDSGDDDATQCAKQQKIDVKRILDCARSDRGHQLLVAVGKQTDKIHHDWVPWVLINGYQLQPTDVLKTEICKRLSNPPGSCKK